MGMKHWAMASLGICALGLSACQSERLGRLNTQPAPLTPAPVAPVTQGQLPPPSQPQANDPSQFPVAPGTETGETEVAATDLTQPAQPPAGAQPLTKNAMVGSWTTTSGGTSCQMFLTLTSYGGGSRGGTRGCPGNLADLRIWKVAGSQLVLSDPDGTQIATLYSSGGSGFSGQTTTGAAISLSC